MVDAYKENVLRAYNDKKASGALSPNLSSSTPARLKDECIMMLTESYKPRDEKIVRSIFGPKEDLKAYVKAIDKETDKFRPLNSFLKGKTTDPDERVVDLLAWLIGFEPRPVLNGYTVNAFKKEKPVVPGDETQKETTVKPDEVEKKRKEKNEHKNLVSTKAKNLGILLAVLVLAGGGTYLLSPNSTKNAAPNVSLVTGSEKCMYWIGDHYLAVPCSQIHRDTPVVPLDTQVLNHLKKITDITSINDNSLGKVWYARLHKDDYEYFTDSGFHPIDTVIRLRPITKFIIGNHILNHKN
jgi:hypothetical protein